MTYDKRTWENGDVFNDEAVNDLEDRIEEGIGEAGGGTPPAARVYNSAAISIPDNTNTALTFNSERYDNDSIHSTSSNTSRLTATTAGVYQITGHVGFQAGTTGRRQINLRVNGSTYIAIQDLPGTVPSSEVYLSVSADYKLDAGDYVELVAYQNDGSARNVLASGNYSPEFAMHRVSDG